MNNRKMSNSQCNVFSRFMKSSSELSEESMIKPSQSNINNNLYSPNNEYKENTSHSNTCSIRSKGTQNS